MYQMATEPENRYSNYFDYAIRLCGNGSDTTVECIYAPYGKICEKITFTFKKDEIQYDLASFASIKTEYIKPLNKGYTGIEIQLSQGPADFVEANISIITSRDRISFTSNACDLGFDLMIHGYNTFGNGDSISAVCLEREGIDIRSSFGPSASKIDDTLFCRETDNALRFSSDDTFRLHYDFTENKYAFSAVNQLRIWAEEDIFRRLFHVKYKGINKNSTFKTPPCGWMTWYAVMFDGCESAVLENAQKQKELFADYGANSIWVDWEWYHSLPFYDENVDQSIHFFSPDPSRYPNGLKYVSDKIKEMGFTPALWVGVTNDPAWTDFMAENEHSVYINRNSWCGKYFYDLTNDAYLNDFIPRAFNQVKEWGYEAVKWDCLPSTLEYGDIFHSYLTDSSLTTEQALRNVIQIARNTLGEDFYMLSCSGENDRTVLFASDIFDSARIGADIFGWQEFIENCLDRTNRFYSFHNNMIYCDPDNLVIRPEYNTYDQAITRTSFISLLGLPVNLGDDLRTLPEDRIDLIRRALPALDIRPMDIRESIQNPNKIISNLLVTMPYEEWNVVQVTNLLTEANTITVDFDKDLHMDEGSYLVYEYWTHKFLGIMDGSVTLELPAYSSAVLSIRKYTGKKQLVSTSRHITQGAFDIVDVSLDEKGDLRGRSKVVANEPYVITYYDPEEKAVFEKSFTSHTTGEMDWVI